MRPSLPIGSICSLRKSWSGKYRDLPMRLGGIERRDKISREEVLEAVKAARAAGVQGLTAETGTLVQLPISSDWVTYLVDDEYDATDIESLNAAEISGRTRALWYIQVNLKHTWMEKAFIRSNCSSDCTRGTPPSHGD